MITISFVIFKCNLTQVDQDSIDEYSQDVHGLGGGANTLNPHQEIEVDTKIACQIEQNGSDKRAQIFNSVFRRCVSRGIISNTSNKSEYSLRNSRSGEFMTELARACSKTYFARFKMHLNEALTDADIDEDFN